MSNILYITIFVVVTAILGYYFKKNDQEFVENFESFNNTEERTDTIQIYDKFYSNVYDTLFESQLKNEFELFNIVNYSIKEDKHFKKEDINFLDLGCGTGYHLQVIKKHKYPCAGIDNSITMLKKARKNNPTTNLVNGDFHQRSNFKNRQFSHITCFFFTIYYSNNPTKLFNNVNYWLKPNGYFCVHLVDKTKFDPVLEKSSSLIPFYNPQKHSEKRVTKTKLKFNKFKYVADWIFNKKKSHFIENFVFDNKHIQNKHTLYIKNISYYTSLAKKCGFELIKIIDLLPVNHDNNYIYIFKKKYGR